MKRIISLLILSTLLFSCTKSETAIESMVDNETAILGYWYMTRTTKKDGSGEHFINNCPGTDQKAKFCFFDKDGTFINGSSCSSSSEFMWSYSVTNNFLTIDSELHEIKKLTDKELIFEYMGQDLIEFYQR